MKILSFMKWISLLFLFISSAFLNAKEKNEQTSLTKIQWIGDKLEFFSSPNLVFRPVKQERDLEAYQALFLNATAMKYYANGQPRDITNRFKIWENRWQKHNFSALAIYLKADSTEQGTEIFVGHAILGHGDYLGDPNYGISETALIIHPHFWNAKYADSDQEIGIANQTNIGTEVVRAVRAYAQLLSELGFAVPVDVATEQQEEVQYLIQNEVIQDYIANENGEIETIFIPFRAIKATCLQENKASHRIFSKIFVEENEGILISPYPTDPTRDLFISPLR